MLAHRRRGQPQAREAKTNVAKAVACRCGTCRSDEAASAKELKSVGLTLGTLGNPFFVAVAKGAEAKAKEINPNVKVTATSADYDLNKQFSQMDNFIAAGVDLILLNAADPRAILPAVKRAQQAGIVVVAVDVAAGRDATVQTNNTQAGQLAREHLAEKIGGKGNVIIQNGPRSRR